MLSENTILQNGKYRIIGILGQGGFGITYLGMDALLGRKVAIKELYVKEICERNKDNCVITSEINKPIFDRLHRRFLKEAKNLTSINHPNIIRVFDCFEENSTAYYTMEYIDGINIHQYVKNKGALPESEAISIIQQAADALSYIHTLRITHLDVKPSNLMLTKLGNKVMLIDFGLSIQYSNTENTTTMPSMVSNGFSALEMYNTSIHSEFSPATDVYSLAATLLFMLTGKTPPSALDLAMGTQLNFPSSILPATKETILKSLTTNKANRLNSISDFLATLSSPSLQGSTTKTVNSNIGVSDKEETVLLQNNYSGVSNKTLYTGSSKKGIGPFKLILLILIIIAIIVGCLFATGKIVSWNEVAPINLTPYP